MTPGPVSTQAPEAAPSRASCFILDAELHQNPPAADKMLQEFLVQLFRGVEMIRNLRATMNPLAASGKGLGIGRGIS